MKPGRRHPGQNKDEVAFSMKLKPLNFSAIKHLFYFMIHFLDQGRFKLDNISVGGCLLEEMILNVPQMWVHCSGNRSYI